MKRLLSISMAVILTLSLSATSVFAKNDKEKKGHDSIENTVVSAMDLIKGHENDEGYIKDLMKQYHKDKEIRKALLKRFVELRKQHNDDSMPIFVKGGKVETEVPPVIKGDRMLIPVRAVTNALGADVLWSSETRTVTVTKSVYGQTYGGTTIKIEIKLDSNIVYVNGQQQEIDVPAQLVNERTMVPIRFISETFRQRVEWDNDSRSVLIDDEDEDKPAATPTATPVPTTQPQTSPSPTPTPVPTTSTGTTTN